MTGLDADNDPGLEDVEEEDLRRLESELGEAQEKVYKFLVHTFRSISSEDLDLLTAAYKEQLAPKIKNIVSFFTPDKNLVNLQKKYNIDEAILDCETFLFVNVILPLIFFERYKSSNADYTEIIDAIALRLELVDDPVSPYVPSNDPANLLYIYSVSTQSKRSNDSLDLDNKDSLREVNQEDKRKLFVNLNRIINNCFHYFSRSDGILGPSEMFGLANLDVKSIEAFNDHVYSKIVNMVSQVRNRRDEILKEGEIVSTFFQYETLIFSLVVAPLMLTDRFGRGSSSESLQEFMASIGTQLDLLGDLKVAKPLISDIDYLWENYQNFSDSVDGYIEG